MYWTEWSTKASIELCGMDGRDQRSLISNDLQHPSSLTLDKTTETLYWVDLSKHHIEMLNLESGAHRVNVNILFLKYS